MIQAARLRQVADLLEPFTDWIDPAQHISVSLNDDRQHEIHVHDTQPPMLESIERDHSTETVSEDADGIVRYVTVKTDDLEITWHRR